MAKYKVKATYSVDVKDPKTNEITVEQRKYDKEKYHGGSLLKVGDVVDLTEEQLKIHGEKYFELVIEKAEPVTETEPVTEEITRT